jgi:crossover junction endodeoxyribonuclease RuvC
MRILGIDPGCGFTGYGIIETDGSQHAPILFGAIGTRARQPLQERLLTIYTGLSRILASEEVHVVAIEEVFHAANVQSSSCLRILSAGNQELHCRVWPRGKGPGPSHGPLHPQITGGP